MAERMKDSYGPEVALWVGQRLAGVLPSLDAQAFAAECLPGYEDLELMDRARRITEVMARHLPTDPAVAVGIITASLGPIEDGLTGMQPFRYLPFVFYVGQFGLGAFDESMTAQYELTRRFTAEFSIRPFLIHHEAATLARLRQWARDPDPTSAVSSARAPARDSRGPRDCPRSSPTLRPCWSCWPCCATTPASTSGEASPTT